MGSGWLVALLVLLAVAFGGALFALAARGVNEARTRGRLHAGWSIDEAGWHPESLD